MNLDEISLIRKAWLTPAVSTVDGLGFGVSGAVYDRARILESTRRVALGGATFRRLLDPSDLDQTESVARRLAGTWLYGGHWHEHFGHFLLETFSNLWPEPQPWVDGIVFHRESCGAPTTWQYALIRRSGWDVPVVWVDGTPGITEIEWLLAPDSGFRIRVGARAGVRRLWDRASSGHPTVGPVMFSRTGGAGIPLERTLPGDVELEERLEQAGIRVVHPQLLTIDEQLDVAASATALIGVEGSQLHLSAFARPGTPVVSICSPRNPDNANPNQWLIGAHKNQPVEVVPLTTRSGERSVEDTLERVEAVLRRNRRGAVAAPKETVYIPGPAALVERLIDRAPVDGALLQIGSHPHTGNHPIHRPDRLRMPDPSETGPVALVHLLDPASVVEQYRTFIAAVRTVVPGGGVLIANTIPRTFFHDYFALRPGTFSSSSPPGAPPDHEFWHLLLLVARLHPEIGFRTVLGNWRAHTLCWTTARNPIQSAEGTPQFAELLDITVESCFSEGVPPWFACTSVDDAAVAWGSRVAQTRS